MASQKQNPNTTALGYLQPGTRFEGLLCFDGTLKIGGSFKGEIRSDGTLVVDEGGVIEGDIYVGELILKGRAEGMVRAQHRVSMLAPAHFRGSVSSPNLKIEEGVSFEGTSSVQHDAQP